MSLGDSRRGAWGAQSGSGRSFHPARPRPELDAAVRSLQVVYEELRPLLEAFAEPMKRARTALLTAVYPREAER
jgi:hypothetical protein